MPARDNDKRRDFAIAFATSGNATAAARQAGVSEASAHSMGYKWLRSPDVIAMVRAEQEQALRNLTGVALKVVANMLEDETAPAQVRLAAAREVLDRAGFAKPKRREIELPAKEKPVEEMSRAEIEALLAAELQVEPGELPSVLGLKVN